MTITKYLCESIKCQKFERNVIFLTCAGLVPFIILTLSLRLNWFTYINIFNLLLTYAALILSFLGGIQWGVGLLQPDKCAIEFPYLFSLSILPPLIAWLLLGINNNYWQLVGFIFAFSGVLIVDIIITFKKILPSWFLKLRIAITIIVIGLLMLSCF
jgi:hypothetical protein